MIDNACKAKQASYHGCCNPGSFVEVRVAHVVPCYAFVRNTGFVHAVLPSLSVTSHLTHLGFLLLKSHWALLRSALFSDLKTLPLPAPLVLNTIFSAGEQSTLIMPSLLSWKFVISGPVEA